MTQYNVKQYYFANNPIIIKFINTGATKLIHYRIYVDAFEFEYEGQFNLVSDFILDLQDFFEGFDIQNVVAVEFAAWSVDSNGNAQQGFYDEILYILPGGVSKISQRDFTDNSTHNDYIIDRILNFETNFLLTNRTAKNLIKIPENELLPLYFFFQKSDQYNSVRRLYMKNINTDFDGNGEVIAQVNNEEYPELKSLDIRNRWEKYFDIYDSQEIGGSYPVPVENKSFRIVVTEAEHTDYFIDFRNSFNFTERIALYNFVEYMPEIEVPVDYKQFDLAYYFDVIRQNRKKLKNVFYATIKCADYERFNFVLDMLLSDKCSLIIKNTHSYSAKVELDGDTKLNTYTCNSEIKVKITLNYEETIVNQFVTVSDTIPEKDNNSNRIFDGTFDGTFG